MLKQNLRALGKLVSPDFKRQSSIFAKKKPYSLIKSMVKKRVDQHGLEPWTP